MSKTRAKDSFQIYLVEKGLKSTRQRDLILEEFLRAGSHLSTEDLYLRLRRKHPNIGYATVYRTLRLLADCGIAEERHFGDGQTRYESSVTDQHHDHLVCTKCGKITEFEEPQIERLQVKVAKAHGFTIDHHRLELYGHCQDCSD